jgi:hypothetical protein
MKTTLFTLALVIAVFAVGCSSNGPVANDGSSSSSTLTKAIDDGGNIRSGRIEGTISAVNVAERSFTIITVRGTAVTTVATAGTKIERNGFHASLNQFRIGDRGQSRFDPATMIASKMEATGN